MRISVIASTNPNFQIFANPIYFILRSFIDTQYPENSCEWVAKIHCFKSVNDAVTQALAPGPDVVLLSAFIFNAGETKAIIQEIRNRDVKVKIVVGGPDVNARQVEQNWITWPTIDAVIYGDGEVAFLELVKRWEKTQQIRAGLNCATPSDVGFYQRFRWEDWKPYPVYGGALCADWLEANKLIEAQYVDNTQGRKGVAWHIETNRGCPYGCSFCDWSSGLHHKVTIKPLESVYADIEVFKLLPNAIHYINDANFFQLKRDEAILQQLNESGITYRVGNWSKLKKETVYEYFIKNADKMNSMVEEGHLGGQTGLGRAAMQSIKKETLDAIDRPEIPWEKHKALLQEYKAVRNHELKISAELINDLPLMTDQDYVWQALELYETGIELISLNNWEFLPNAPANDEQFLEKWNLQLVKHLNILQEFKVGKERDKILEQLSLTNHFYSLNHVYERGTSNTFGVVIGELYNWCDEMKHDFKEKLSQTIDILIGLSQLWTKSMQKNKLSDGTIVWGWYDVKKQTYIPHNIWLKETFSRINYNKINAPEINHPQYVEIHKIIKQYVSYHKTD